MKLYTYTFGSQLLKLENCRDLDTDTYADIPPRNSGDIKAGDPKSISFYRHLISAFIRNKYAESNIFYARIMYQLSEGFHPESDYVFKPFNILNYKRQWVRALKRYINSEEVAARLEGREVLPKAFYHMLYQYYMIVENTHWISAEGKAKIQAIHDEIVPVSYFEELRALINNLNEGDFN